jgi:hypothetical protein
VSVSCGLSVPRGKDSQGEVKRTGRLWALEEEGERSVEVQGAQRDGIGVSGAGAVEVDYIAGVFEGGPFGVGEDGAERGCAEDGEGKAAELLEGVDFFVCLHMSRV